MTSVKAPPAPVPGLAAVLGLGPAVLTSPGFPERAAPFSVPPGWTFHGVGL